MSDAGPAPVSWRSRLARAWLRRDERGSRGLWIVALSALTAAALVLAFLLAVATDNRQFYERHYGWLVVVNVVIAAVLIGVLVVGSVRLAARVLRGRFGSRLLLRLSIVFALVAALPGVLVYTVSYQFVSRSIESWFDVQVEGALEAGLSLGRGTIDTLVAELATKTRLAAERMGDAPEREQPLALERLREQLFALDVAIVGAQGQVIRSVGTGSALTAERPPPSLMRTARNARVATQVEGLDDDSTALAGRSASAAAATSQQPARARALAPIASPGFALEAQERYLMVTQLLPAALTANALAVQGAYREYQQRSLAREGLRRMYIGTLTLTLILAVFGAMLLAVAFGNRLARPLLLLADGVREVARGDLGPKPVFASHDELGGLTRSFADMTRQLAEARALVERGVGELQTERGKLQAILDNMSAGVIVFDAAGRIDSVNAGATRILRVGLAPHLGRPLADVPGLADFDALLRERFAALDAVAEAGEPGERDQWQQSFELRAAPGRPAVTLLARGVALPPVETTEAAVEAAETHSAPPGPTRLVVFDDITELVSAQRAEAWGEVARRLAHEIKNPLTPIQLSAERLQMRLVGKLDGPERQLLDKATATIVTQVQAMKQLVNEFRDYARLPAAKLLPLDLAALVQEVIGLYGQAQESGRLRVELPPGLPWIEGDASQLRQVVHNLLQNALDAVAERQDGRVTLRLEGRRGDDAAAAGGQTLRLVVTDNGPGFDEHVLKRAFEPYVTTKLKGTGLGLAVVKKIADEHGARIRLRNLHQHAAAHAHAGDPGEPEGQAVAGAQVSLSFSKCLPARG
ncbi:MAG TPA: ATP-binding protein [Methylibium sp.]|uniref:sensor histidine kinase n=1 Tax=Methylibium sp. TaxID=2067992 RepID=UPI002DBBD318|nr:ATP-binding protein [Methylibium sp.]HEU4458713.1 ATP-binding protein [Methylibium sp.]